MAVEMTASMFRYNAENGPATHSLGLRVLIAKEMDKHGPSCDLSHLDISKMTSLDEIFSHSPFNGDISKWDTAHITSMQGTFRSSAFTGDISRWNTANVVRMPFMFANSKFTGDISAWDTGNAIQMDHMFMGSVFDNDISAWNVSNMINAEGMFEYSHFNGDLSKWDVSELQFMGHMFRSSRFQGDISAWTLEEAVQMEGMFEQAAYAGNLSQWNLPTWAMPDQLCSPDFAGVLPRMRGQGSAHEMYARMFGSSSHLHKYLLRRPLNAVHADLALRDSLDPRPAWLDQEECAWLQQQKTVLAGLGCTTEDTRALLVAVLKKRNAPNLTFPESILHGMELG